MSFDILLDSSLAKLERGGERNVSHNFTVKFHPPIDLGEGNYKAALNRLITMSYSRNNIDSRYDNNKIRWKKKTEQAWKTLISRMECMITKESTLLFSNTPVK